MWKVLERNGGDTGAEDPGTTGSSTSWSATLQAPSDEGERPTSGLAPLYRKSKVNNKPFA